MLRARLACALIVSALASAAPAQEDVAPGAPSFKEGDTITFDQVESLKAFLPPEFWANRDFFFYEGMQLEIGPAHRDYAPARGYLAARRSSRARRKVGPEASLENYTAGQPFPRRDRLQGRSAGRREDHLELRLPVGGRRRATRAGTTRYWDRGEQLPLYYEGTAKTIQMSRRVEPEYLANGGDLFRGEKRKNAFGIEVDAPFDARGILLMTYRYKDAENAEGGDQERRHLGVRADAAPRAPHLLGAAHRRRLGHRLHASTTCAASPGIVPAVPVGVPGRRRTVIAPMNTQGGRPTPTRATTTSGRTGSPTPTTAGSCARP